jgi:hypothetical protein
VDESQELLIGSAWLKVVGRSSLAVSHPNDPAPTTNDGFLQTSGSGNGMANVTIGGLQRPLGFGAADLRF